MSSFAELVEKLRTLFDLAKEVTDSVLMKSLQEADMLDVKSSLCGDTFLKVSADFGGGKAGVAPSDDYNITVIIDGVEYSIVPLSTILCYYAFVRYLRASDQTSTSTGLKLQTFGNSIIVPDVSKNKRWEDERGKADAFMEDFKEVYELSKNPPKCCGGNKNYRVCFIK